MKHTSTPWVMNITKTYAEDTRGLAITNMNGTVLIASVNHDLYDKTLDEYCANAERIVACVNAMDGIEDPKKFMEQRDNNGWISVKDAMPEKGKEVFAYFQNIKDEPRVIKAFFIGKFQLEADFFSGDPDYDGHGNAYWPEGWYENNEFEEVHWKVDATITHWMPIPEPPTQK